jgi:hypothetical protein
MITTPRTRERMPRTRAKRRPLLAGVALYAAVQSLWEDFLGRDRYVRAVSDGWVSARITVPLALLLLVYVATQIVPPRRRSYDIAAGSIQLDDFDGGRIITWREDNADWNRLHVSRHDPDDGMFTFDVETHAGNGDGAYACTNLTMPSLAAVLWALEVVVDE